MAKLNQPPPQPRWPWGGLRSVRERLVQPTQLERTARKKGDPKNPELASHALLDFIGPAHSSEELRLPEPPPPRGHDADLSAFQDRGFLEEIVLANDVELRKLLDRAMSLVSASGDRLNRMKALLSREAQMLTLLERISAEQREIERRRREEQREEGY